MRKCSAHARLNSARGLAVQQVHASSKTANSFFPHPPYFPVFYYFPPVPGVTMYVGWIGVVVVSVASTKIES